MPLLSVVTATHPPTNQFLLEAGESIRRALPLPAGWEMEWVIQEDLSASELRSEQSQETLPAGEAPPEDLDLNHFDFVRHGRNQASHGISVTRNLALARARGELIRNLDADDLLAEDGLSPFVSVLEEDRSLAFSVGRVEDIFPDSSRAPFSPGSFGNVEWEGDYLKLMTSGRYPAGDLNRISREHGVFPIHCAGITARRSDVLALGGYAAIPRNEDLALWAALSEIKPFFYLDKTAFYYRRWPGQTTNQGWWLGDGPLSDLFVEDRIEAIREPFLGQPDPES